MGSPDSSHHHGPASQGVPPSSGPQGPESRGFGGEAAPLDPSGLAPPPKSADVRHNLGVGKGGKLKRWLWRLVALLVLGAVVAAVVWWRGRAGAEDKVEYVTKPATRGNLEATVTATGSLQGRDTVEVGAEVSGTVKAVHVDFNDLVKEGQVLCEIDPQQLAAARDQTRAQLMAAQAEYSSRKVTAKEARATADRTKALAAEGLVSQQQLETAIAAAARAEAGSRSAAAQITVTRASLESSQTKLDKAKIVAPMDGVVLARSVEVGQTVAASLQAPVLFTLARNLKEMELTVAIDEADIGQVTEGQAATFVVDAFPERTFSAELQSIHNIGTLQNNVVTYEALLSVKNDDLS
ncbi:MAG: efflux RND transporter periplasmic adaptor subunit, partial [Deltaproteobacteria bacterium]|nr:efflux RND transporter periplasmic adaptor subunit [Deltaproteobacteria bacterium]